MKFFLIEYKKSYTHCAKPDFSRIFRSYPHYPHAYTHFFCVWHVDFFVYNLLDIIRHYSISNITKSLQNQPFVKFPIIFYPYSYPHYPHCPQEVFRIVTVHGLACVKKTDGVDCS